MSFELQSQPWTGKRAILLVHGIGNAAKGDYKELLGEVEQMLGPALDTTVIYQLWYDQVNDWFKAKTDLGSLLTSAVHALRDSINDPEMGEAIADTVGDLLWPVLVADARTAVREAYIAQLKQIVVDGINSGVPARRQKLSIICHSLGCFHTYEALHHIAKSPSHALTPATHEVVFDNVIYMASPVQLIRTVSEKLGPLVPNRRWLYTVQGDKLSVPFETTITGMEVPSVRRWASITGDLDPVGGFFFRVKAPWAYMEVEPKNTRVDNQVAFNIPDKKSLAKLLLASRRDKLPPLVTANNPHSWENYVRGHGADLNTWIAT